MMAQVNAGRVRFVGRGEYNNSTQYYVFDLVSYNGNSYYAKVDTIGHLPTDTTYWQLVAEKGNVGPTGLTGNGISSITKTSTSGLVDTYTITFTNGNTTTFDVTNGNGIDRIEKTATVGNIDTYTIYFNDNSTSTFEVANGEVTREELEEEVDRLSMIYNAFPSTSNEGEEMTLDGTAEVPFKKLNLKGNTSQFSTTGKNLLNKELFTSSEKISAITMLDTGVQFITTSEASSSTYGRTTANIPLDSTKTYTISCDVTSDESGKFIFGYYGTSGGSQTTNITANTKKSVSYQLSNITSSYVSLGFYLANATVKVENLMIVEGTTIGNYEPYTGGNSSPNPDYPQDIQVVSGDNTIKVEGKNLFNKDSGFRNGYINSSGNFVSAGNTACFNQYISCKPNTTYTLNFSKSIYAVASPLYYDSSKTFISRESVVNNITTRTFTTPANCYYMGIQFNYDNISTMTQEIIDTVQCQVEQGSTATSYEPYQSASYPINLGNIELCKIGDYQDYIRKSTGKNLFNKDSANILNGWLGSTTMRIAAPQVDRLLYIPCEPNTTYTVSRSIITSSFRVATYNSTPMPTMTEVNTDYSISDYSPLNTGTKITITTNANAKYLLVHYGNTNDTNLNESLATIQIEKGNQATSYEPYGKVWCLNKQIGKVVLNGSETIERIPTQLSGYYSFVVSSPTDLKKNNIANIRAGLLMSDKFIEISNKERYEQQVNGILVRITNSYNFVITYDETSSYTVSEFRTWLQNNNILVYYVLATPTTTEITDTTLIEQLDNLENAYSYDTQTNISQTNDDMPFILDVEAILSLKNILEI